MNSLTPELFWLSATIAITALFWMPYIVNRMIENGVWLALWDPKGHTQTKSPWANRMMQAHENAVENLAVFAPLVLTLNAMGIGTSATAGASMIYFVARAAHYVIFTFGLPLLRVIAFLVGFACQAVLALTVFGVL